MCNRGGPIPPTPPDFLVTLKLKLWHPLDLFTFTRRVMYIFCNYFMVMLPEEHHTGYNFCTNI